MNNGEDVIVQYDCVSDPSTDCGRDGGSDNWTGLLCLAAGRPVIRRLSTPSRLTAVSGRYTYPFILGANDIHTVRGVWACMWSRLVMRSCTDS